MLEVIQWIGILILAIFSAVFVAVAMGHGRYVEIARCEFHNPCEFGGGCKQ